MDTRTTIVTLQRKNPVYLRVSDHALQEAAEIEGFVPYTYDDKDPKSRKTPITDDNVVNDDGRLTGPFGGTLTKGYGHTRTAKPGDTITRDEALMLFRKDAREAESCVHRYVNVPLTQGEFDGMWDLFFNVGPGRKKGTNGPDDKGKDGIACLGKSDGRPSTLLTELNKGNYDAAAECFTQWRNKGSIWELGLIKRRIRFMLIFMNLPIVRAVNLLPGIMPPTDQARHELVQRCITVAREEAADLAGLAPPEPPEPLPEIVLDKPLPPPVAPPPAPPKPAAPVAPSDAAGPAAVKPMPPPVTLPPVVKVDTKPPPDPVIIAPKSVDVKSIPYGEVDPANGAKNMSDSQRGVGMVIVGIGSLVQIVTMRLGVGTAVGAIFFDLSRDPVVIALAATGVAVVIGWLTRKKGTKVMTKGMIEAKTLLK
jgi:lysozyme